MGYSFRLTAWVLLYASSHIQDSTYHGLCYTSRGALAGTTVDVMATLIARATGGAGGRKEGNVLFNDALNTFYFTVIWRRTYGKGPLR